MLLKKFRETGPDVIVLIFIILVLIWLNALIHPRLPAALNFDKDPMPFFGFLLSIAGFHPFFSLIVTVLLVLLTSFLLVSLNTSVFFISERTFLPALIFILLSGLIPGQQILNPVLPAAVFLILALRKIMDSYKIQGTAYTFFDAGLLIGTGSLFYGGFIWFGLLLLIGIAILRTGNPKEIAISLLGLATPWFITAGIYYVAGKDLNDLASVVKYNLFSGERNYTFSGLNAGVLIVSGIVLIISTLHLLSVINMKKIKSRKTFVLLIWIFILSAGMYMIFKSVSAEIFWLAAIPVSYILSHYFVFERSRLIPGLMFTTLFILVALIQVMGFLK